MTVKPGDWFLCSCKACPNKCVSVCHKVNDDGSVKGLLIYRDGRWTTGLWHSDWTHKPTIEPTDEQFASYAAACLTRDIVDHNGILGEIL